MSRFQNKKSSNPGHAPGYAIPARIKRTKPISLKSSNTRAQNKLARNAFEAKLRQMTRCRLTQSVGD